MNSVMVDLETLGTGPEGLILTIGARRFDRNTLELGDIFHQGIDIESALQMGMKVDGSTLVWWLAPERQEARVALARVMREKNTLSNVLRNFVDWVRKDPKCKYIWGHGASFDPVLISSAFRLCGLADLNPFKYWDMRDTRTLFDEMRFDYQVYNKANNTTTHDALADATCQAKAVIQCLQTLHAMFKAKENAEFFFQGFDK